MRYASWREWYAAWPTGRWRRIRTGIGRGVVATIAVASVAVGLVAVVGSPPAAAASFNTRAASVIAAGPGIRLSKMEFHLHEGNDLCPGANGIPDSIAASSQQSFCYQASGFIGAGTHDTEFSFRYYVWVPGKNGDWVSSGYAVEGHVQVVDYFAKNDLTCSVVKFTVAASRHFSCNVSTGNDPQSRDPEPRWTVTGVDVPTADSTVYFLGDSVTAGFGYCGTEGGVGSADVNCAVNQPFNNDWTGTNSLSACAPGTNVNDRCSNNNYHGAPWDTGAWVPVPGAPSIAYSYVIARQQSPVDAPLIENWAITGSTPAEWDPVTHGRFGDQLQKIKDSYVVMTLGANPLLSDYLKISVVGVPKQVGPCAGGTVDLRKGPLASLAIYAQSLGHGPNGILNCFDREWEATDQAKHLLDVYQSLLDNGNHVLVLGYPLGCPWSFGNWQSNANLFSGPAAGNSCRSLSHPTDPSAGQPSTTVTQWDQAVAVANYANDAIAAAVAQAGQNAKKPGDIAFAPQSPDWANHQAWDSDPWIFKNDTWVHPNAQGHQQLAKTVVTAMCRDFKHWCGSPPQWKSP